jgi:hypothetical protein
MGKRARAAVGIEGHRWGGAPVGWGGMVLCTRVAGGGEGEGGTVRRRVDEGVLGLAFEVAGVVGRVGVLRQWVRGGCYGRRRRVG